MRLLLDTHALIWWWKDDPVLRPYLRTTMGDPQNEIFVSAVTAWEIATKVRKGQLPELSDRLPGFRGHVEQDGFSHLPITPEHGVHGGSLPGPHKDPFDRLIAAQSLLENLTVITRDPEIAAFGCEVLW
ncbi:MAG TPA: type II toxin-antitoxin system VapC family toxin [Sphingomonas sp.]|jgi:PIN domain nuclease of toxin-antitoxin system|nr:type II toxin-antitoxin system VapC family toxin [Sphingomonas sp.]